MTVKKIVGLLIIAALFVVTAITQGVIEALVILGTSILIGIVVALGVVFFIS